MEAYIIHGPCRLDGQSQTHMSFCISTASNARIVPGFAGGPSNRFCCVLYFISWIAPVEVLAVELQDVCELRNQTPALAGAAFKRHWSRCHAFRSSLERTSRSATVSFKRSAGARHEAMLHLEGHTCSSYSGTRYHQGSPADRDGRP
jgi:hypothetical protein